MNSRNVTPKLNGRSQQDPFNKNNSPLALCAHNNSQIHQLARGVLRGANVPRRFVASFIAAILPARGVATPPLYRRIRRVRMWMKVAATLTPLLLLAAEGRAQSAFDGFDPGVNSNVIALVVQADGKILVGGIFTGLGGGTGTTTRNGIGRLNPDGTLDTSFNPGANGGVRALAVQADGKILVGGFFTGLGGGTGTTTRNNIGRLNPDGTVDTTFNPGANDNVNALAVQADGKIVVGGYFTTLGGGGTGTATRKKIGRLNPDGSLDTSFDPGVNGDVYALAVQADGKILVGGYVTGLGGGSGTTTRNGIGRLNPDGTVDTGFDPGANDTVWALAVQADGKILGGGSFTTLGGGGTGTTVCNRIGRLNPDGTLDTSFNPGANNVVFALAVQADGKILVGGGFTTLGGGGTGTTTRNNIGRLNPNGTLDTSLDPGANNVVNALAVQADGKILIGGLFTTLGGGGTGTTTRNRLGRLNPDGTLDTSLDPGANNVVTALAVQADGKILVGGGFTTLGGGGTGTTERNYIGRLNPDGALDASFNPGANFEVWALAVQADGKILVGGLFSTLGGGGTGTTERNTIGRLNPDGTLDTSFNPGTNNNVIALTVQADGKILVGGGFTTLGGGGFGTTTRNNIGRLNSDGTLDSSFNPGADVAALALAVQADGKILVGGQFTTLGGGGTGTTERNYIGRLNPDGTLDSSFNPGANGEVHTLAVQADGKILVGGYFSGLGGGTGTTTRNNIGRLNPDGSLDTSFNPGANDVVYVLAVQADGKILVGGGFTTLGGGGFGTTTRNNIGRLNADGTLDTSFDPGADGTSVALAVQPDGKILVGGNFATLGGGGFGTTARKYIGRLTNTDAALQKLTADTNGTTINWLRSNASPEVDRVTFERSTDAINYTALANPIRISGGWQLTGQSLPTHQNIFIRARGFYSSGRYRSGSIVETVRNAFISPPPIPTKIVSQKTHGTNSFGIDLPLTGSPGIECRTGGAPGNHQVIVTFAVPVTFTFAAVTSGTGSVASATGSGTTAVTANLTGVANAQKITLTLFGVNDNTNAGNLGIPMGVLLGDTSGNGSVNSSDVSQTKSKSGQTVAATNFRTDVTVSNSINSSDVSLVKSKSGTALPP